MELILTQIASSHTAYLLACLDKWELDDLILFITEVISVGMFCECGFLEPRLANAYTSALPYGRHPLGPCIAFIADLAAQNETTYEAAILSKFLDLVLLTAARPPPGSLDSEDQQAPHCAFAVLSAPPCDLYDFWRLNLEQYWVVEHEHDPSLGDVVRHIDKTSPATWLILEAHFLQREAPRMLRLTTPLKYPMYTGRSAADENYPSFKDFSLTTSTPVFTRQEILDTGVVSSAALWHFLRCVALGGDVHGLMAAHLKDLSHRSRVSLFSRMIYRLLHNTRESRSAPVRDLCARVGGRHRLNTVLTRFLLSLAQSHLELKYALVDAVLVLVIPLLVPEMKSWAVHEDLFRRSHFFPALKLRPSYSKATLRLFGVMREGALASVIGPGEPGSRRSCEIAEVLEPIFNG
ncbi:hypothetical protein C8R46DRAFT_372295 [Mycena filopes]|nr:hypothetical protein C8R46DRAFT_372295 [Mycena filopes]